MTIEKMAAFGRSIALTLLLASPFAAGAFPNFESNSSTIDNQYLRFDRMGNPELFSGWGPGGHGDWMGYYDEGIQTVQTMDWTGPSTVNINCRRVRVSSGHPADDITIFLAQDSLDDVYVVRIMADFNNDGVADDLTFPASLDTTNHIPLYMPHSVSGPGMFDQTTFLSYQSTREVVEVNCCELNLFTLWGDENGHYTGNLLVKSTSTNGGDIDVGYEYYHPEPAPGIASGGLIRTADEPKTSGFDRGLPPPTPTPTATATATATPSPVPTWTDVGWSKASSEAPMAGLLLYGDKKAHGMAGLPAAASVAQQHILAHFASDSRWYTGIAVANPSQTTTANINLTAYGNDGVSVGTASFDVPPNGKVSKLMKLLFGSDLGTGWINLTSNVDVVAFDLYGDVKSGGIAALSSCQLSNTLVIPHFVTSDRWWTGVAVVNPNDSQIWVRMTAYKEDGTPITHQDWLTVAAKSKIMGLVDSTTLLPDLSAGDKGWISIQAPSPIGGVLVFGDKKASPNEIAALPAVPTSTSLEFSHFKSNAAWWTGIVTVNPSSTTTANVTLRAYQGTGVLIQEVPLSIAKLSKKIGLVSDLFPSLGAIEDGWVEATSDLPISGMELINANSDPEEAWGLAGIEAQPTGSQVYLTHYDVTTRWWTLFALANPSNSVPINAGLWAFDNNGVFAGDATHPINPKGRIVDDVKSLFGH